MNKRFKIIHTNMEYVFNTANYHVSHGDYKIIKIETGRFWWIRKKYLCITMECPDVSIELNNKKLMQMAVEREDYHTAIKLRDQIKK